MRAGKNSRTWRPEKGEKGESPDAAAVAATAAAAVPVAAATGKVRKRKVQLLHVSRPLVGGLVKVPENVGELDMATVDKYAAVLKSYPGESIGVGVEVGDGRGVEE